MKILITVDNSQRYRSILAFIEALQLVQVSVRFIHAISPILDYDGPYVSLATNGSGIFRMAWSEASIRLIDACKEAEALGFSARWGVDVGLPAEVIEAQCAEYKPDLVAFATDRKSPLKRLLEGSVALVIARNCACSLLFVRTDKKISGRLCGVFAADHSPIADECLDRFLSWRPKGVSQMEVLTAFQFLGQESIVAGRNEIISRMEVDAVVISLLREKTEGVAARFRNCGISARSNCIELAANLALPETVTRTGADLLILPTKGERLGPNISGKRNFMHEIEVEPCSVLILRPASI